MIIRHQTNLVKELELVGDILVAEITFGKESPTHESKMQRLLEWVHNQEPEILYAIDFIIRMENDASVLKKDLKEVRSIMFN